MTSLDNRSSDESTNCAWGMFVDTLICQLGVIGDGEMLALVAPADSNGLRSQLVLRADRGRDLVWVTRGVEGSTAAEEVVAQAGEGGYFEIADAIGRVAREELRLPHPQLFTAAATGMGAARLADQLGLAVASTVVAGDAEFARERGDAAGRSDVASGWPDALRPLAVEVLREVTGQDPVVDDDGDLFFDIDGTRCIMLFSPDGSLVQLQAQVVRRIYSRRNTAVELDLLNSKGLWNTWFMNGREVYLRSAVPARPLTADNLQRTLRFYAQELCAIREELAYRLGGVAA